jgi:hypothetical protein
MQMAPKLYGECWMVRPYSLLIHEMSDEEHWHLCLAKRRARCKWFEPIVLSDEKLLWRVSDNYFNKQQFEDCLLWANLAYHELLRQSNSNDAKIIRLNSLGIC